MSNFQMKAPRSVWSFQCHDKSGKLLWEETDTNIVFDAAITDILSVYFKSGPQRTAWYIGLLNSPATLVPSDTMATHPGWTENINYTSPGRPILTLNPVTGKQVDNSGAKAVFTMSGVGGNIIGAFLASDSTKNGNLGMLYAAAPFITGVKNMAATDTLTVTVILSGA